MKNKRRILPPFGTRSITKSKMSPASIGGGFHLLFSVGVQSPTETLNDGALPLIETYAVVPQEGNLLASFPRYVFEKPQGGFMED